MAHPREDNLQQDVTKDVLTTQMEAPNVVAK